MPLRKPLVFNETGAYPKIEIISKPPKLEFEVINGN